jgi:hypothetical protein
MGSPHSGQKRVPGALAAPQRRQLSVREGTAACGAKSKSGAIGRCGGRLETRGASSGDRTNVRCCWAGRSVPPICSDVPQSAQNRSCSEFCRPHRPQVIIVRSRPPPRSGPRRLTPLYRLPPRERFPYLEGELQREQVGDAEPGEAVRAPHTGAIRPRARYEEAVHDGGT